jgi:hypothetical protein
MPRERTVTASMKAPEQQPTAADADEKLHRLIDLVCEDAALVELWACALNGFAQPVPEYGLGVRDGHKSKPNPG